MPNNLLPILAITAAVAALANPFIRASLTLGCEILMKLVIPYVTRIGFETQDLVVFHAKGPAWRLSLPGWSRHLEIHCIRERESRFVWL